VLAAACPGPIHEGRLDIKGIGSIVPQGLFRLLVERVGNDPYRGSMVVSPGTTLKWRLLNVAT
jgi:hypothetical protein